MKDIDNIQDPQLRYYYKHPQKYAETARAIDLCMFIGKKPCVGYSCDLDAPCKRHDKTAEIVNRYLKMKCKQK